ncbi:DUF456 domain-containing protein [Flavobacterium sp. CS20]|uniref:DUF456 domain-containing protein n=1 Tax=Flavobacterium sp. CS20 TaxID=2775246 RepID=UPI001B3A505A|nr:DUF456 domain-containing protein [Flavobacterium sp. CS20]QTY26155.1 DUF456 domain-containing protein [Flavobacterium sp. CS20]
MVLEILLLSLGILCCLSGIIGSILPVLPGPPISWLGLLMLYLIPDVAIDYWFLGITLGIAVFIFVMDYIIPIVGTKYFGGTRAGAIGSTIGLVVGLFFPPFGVLLGPFIGAFLGEILFNINSNSKHAFKSALGSFVGFLASTFMKLLVSTIYLGLFVYKLIENWSLIFSS